MAPRTDAELLAMADRLSAAFFLSARGRPGASIREDPDVVYGTSGIPLPIFNGATCARFTAVNADERIGAVLGLFREQGIDMSWFVGSTSTPADLVARLLAHGLAIEETAPVMCRDLTGWRDEPARPVPEGLTIEQVADRAGFHDASVVMFEAFGIPFGVLDVFEERFSGYAIGPDAVQQVFVARRDGEAVSTALGFILDGVVGIYNVATRPSRERLGAGTAVTRATIDDAVARGATAALLESSQAGYQVYERLGFHEVGTVTVLVGIFGEAAADRER
jgi:ribosomal protein S18 acetylase RimI-like enzyme